MAEIAVQTETRSLRYFFKDDELKGLSLDLANQNQELRRVEDEKKSMTSEYGSRLNILKEHISSLSDKVSSGYEVRNVECEVEYHKPRKNMKTLKRLDTGEVFEDKMSDYDHNLFNQFQEEEEIAE